jgi:hypothetical protein
MSKEKKKNPFSIYWIYAALGFALIAFQLYVSSDSVATIKSRETFFNLVENKGVRNVRIINQVKADFYLSAKGKALVKQAKKGELVEIKKALSKNGPVKNKEIKFELENIGSHANFEEEL